MNQEATAQAQESLNRLVQRASIIIGAFGLGFTAAPTLADPSPTLFLRALLAGTVGMTLAFLVLWIKDRRSSGRGAPGR